MFIGNRGHHQCWYISVGPREGAWETADRLPPRYRLKVPYRSEAAARVLVCREST